MAKYNGRVKFDYVFEAKDDNEAYVMLRGLRGNIQKLVKSPDIEIFLKPEDWVKVVS